MTDGVFFLETREETKHRQFACFSMGVGIGGGGRGGRENIGMEIVEIGFN